MATPKIQCANCGTKVPIELSLCRDGWRFCSEACARLHRLPD